jgi:tRNA (guanine-N7-)-methyltransferase
MVTPQAWRNFYGRRHGKPLRPTQRRHLEELLPGLAVPGIRPSAPPEAPRIDPAALFPAPKQDLWLEIGFGGGEHLHHLALAHREIGFIGCEPFVNGVAMLLGKIARSDPGNIRIHPGDARDLVERLPEGALGRVFLLYPDPWPKTRHHKRRYANPENLAPLARAMRGGAELRLATDIADYADHAVAAVAETGCFEPVTIDEPARAEAWEGWPGTRYEAKALREGRRPHYLVWRRR